MEKVTWKKTMQDLKNLCGAGGGELLVARELWDSSNMSQLTNDQSLATAYILRILVRNGIISDPDKVRRAQAELSIANDFIQG
jgi:hypothetical protein